MKSIFFTNPNNYSALIARLTLGFVLLPHGAQKAFGMFGGYGFNGTMDFLTGTQHLPYIVGLLVIFTELVGSFCLIIGFATRIFSIAIICLMIGIIYTSHLPNGFFMNWSGQQAGEGYEFHLLAIGLAFVTLISGGGKASVDSFVGRRRIY